VGYLTLCRDIAYIRAVESAFDGRSSNEIIHKDGRVYQLTVNPVARNDACAAVLFAVDITEKEQIERMRREFSANVSHELKTPLTSIMGYAEIMMNGIAKPEDFSRFNGQIYTESKRLLTIIDDVIRLSRLDEESMKNEFKQVDLYELSQKVIHELGSKAEASDVTLSLKGKKLRVSGIEEVLHEIIFNLCDNAITYNKKGGGVTVKVSEQDDRVVLSVKDTGVGISPEHQTRIFERFYRVDKSRSKQTGGTGLGLSIVKHGAMLHDAEISLESALGKGTTIKLIFHAE
jgi:two-component system phosphate regulon sensor histidine kinase PhoR